METCQQTVPEAIIAFLESTGGIAEAFYGMPPELREETLKRLPGEIQAAYELFRQSLEHRDRV